MAASGFTPILIYASGTATNVPLAANLTSSASGAELALNYADGKLYFKNSSGVVTLLAGSGGGGPAAGSNTQIQFNNSGVFGASANLTWSGTVLSTTGLTATGAITLNTTTNNQSYTTTGAGTITISSGTAGSINNMNIGATTAGTGKFTAITNSALTSGRVVYSTTGGLETDSANLLYSGTDLTVYGITVGRGAGAVASNTAVGANALSSNSTGVGLVAIGNGALRNSTVSNNTAVGNFALAGTTTGTGNTGVGGGISGSVYAALEANSTGSSNSAFGLGASGGNSTGSNNTSVGYLALYTNTTASNNTAVGYQAGYSNTTGYSNVFVGNKAGYGTTTGYGNVAIGSSIPSINSAPLESLTTGYFNNAVGEGSLGSLTTGASNVAVGANSGSAITTGSNNSILGSYNGNQGGLNITTASNYIVLSDGSGNPRGIFDNNGKFLVGLQTAATAGLVQFRNASAPALSTSVSGTSVQSTPAIQVSKPDATNTTSQIFAQFYVSDYSTGSGQINANGASAVAFGSFSDSRLKENIIDLPSQLDKIMALRPVEFDYIESMGGGHQIGFIAQEVQTVYPDLVGVGENEMLTLTDMNKNDARLIKCIQEQQALITSLTARIEALESR